MPFSHTLISNRLRLATVGLLSLVALLPAVVAEPSLHLRLSGVIGQSQPAATEPYPEIHCQGVAMDDAGRLWTAPSGKMLFGLEQTKAGIWQVQDRLELPVPAAGRAALRWDGKQLWAQGNDRQLYALGTGTAKPALVCRLPEGTVEIEIAPADCTGGFAATGKIFALVGTQVLAFKADGTELGVVLKLPEIPEAKYTGIGLEPGSGDVIVGTGYPDMKLYRYTLAGKQITDGGWPRTGWPLQFAAVNGTAWVLSHNGTLQSVPAVRRTEADVQGFNPAWANYGTGLTPDHHGSWWIASSQGLIHFDPSGRALERIGGICGVRTMTIAADGTVIAAVETGQRLLRFGLDDDPGTPLRGNANEPWRTGFGWKCRTAALAPDSPGYLVLDDVDNRLWRFDPEHTAWSEKPWVALTDAGTFTQARAMAVGDTRVWVLDGDSVREAQRQELKFGPVSLPGLEPTAKLLGLATIWDRLLLGYSATGVQAWQRSADQSYKNAWTSPATFHQIAGMTATEEFIAVLDGEAGIISLLAPADGHRLAVLDGKTVPGGMKPTTIALAGTWLLVADEAGKRILRFKIESGGESK